MYSSQESSMNKVIFKSLHEITMLAKWIFFITLCLVIVPMTQALEISQVGVYDFGVAYDVVYGEDIAYVSGNDGVDIFDVSDRANPEKLTRIENSDGSFGLFLRENTLYIAGADDGFFIANIMDPRNPNIIGIVPGITALNVYVEEDYAYVASGGSFSIIDISDPCDPIIIASVPGSDRRYHVHVLEDTLYLGETSLGLMVYDIGDREEPVYITTVPGTSGIFDIISKGDYLYLACHGNGVKILDISDRKSPEIIGSHNNGGEAYGIHIVDDYLLVADLQQGVEILDISNPRTPTLLARWTDTHPHGVSGDAQYVYLADQDDGLEIFIYGDGVGEPEVIRREDSASDVSLINQIPVSVSVIFIGVLLGIILVKTPHMWLKR